MIDNVSIDTRKVIIKTDIHGMMITAYFVIKEGIASETVIAADDTVAIDAVGAQIAVEVEAAAGARLKKVMTEDHETTGEAVVTTAVVNTAAIVAATLAWNTKATEPIDRLVKNNATPNALNVRGNTKRWSTPLKPSRTSPVAEQPKKPPNVRKLTISPRKENNCSS